MISRIMPVALAPLLLTLGACGTLTTVSPTVYTQVSAGSYHTCAVVSGGTVQCWGGHGYGSKTESNVPVTMPELTGVTAISAGGGHTCVLLHGGTVQCWGGNEEGELGDGSAITCTSTSSSIPVTVKGLTGVTAISAGSGHTCALLNSGSIQCWGGNKEGQLGDGTSSSSSLPVAVKGLTNVTAISTGNAHTCALLSSGAVQCWGRNTNGQLGNGSHIGSSVPVPVPGLTGISAISAGGEHTCALLSSGTVQCWGWNIFGLLGSGVTAKSSSIPVAVAGLTGVTAISLGGSHFCALINDGTARCWGRSADGELGGADSGRDDLVTVANLSNMTAISAGHKYTCALRSDGSIWCWGNNWFGQLGNGTKFGSRAPVAVVPPGSCLLERF